MNNNLENVNIQNVSQLAFPMMLSMFGWSLTFTLNRIIIAKYDLNLMNVVFVVGTLAFMFEHFLSTITVTSEIFSGQFNGLKRFDKTPVATWQMIFFSIMSIPLFLLVAFFGAEFIIPHEYYEISKDYFTLVLSFMWLAPIKEALSGFFVGIKKTSIIFYASVITNLTSVTLTFLFVFGVEGYIPSMGIVGAGLAMAVKFFVETLVLFVVFLSKRVDHIYKTRTVFYDSIIFYRAIKLGLPNAVGLVAEIGGSFVVQYILIKMLEQYVTEYNIVLNSFILIIFINIGTQKAVTSIASNLIGDNDLTQFDNLIQSSIKFLIIILSVVAVLFFFLGNNFTMLYTTNPEEISHIYNLIFLMLLCTLFDGIGLIFSGVTLSAGDTKFTMYVNIFVVWVFKVFPTYFFIKLGFEEYYIAWLINVFMTIIYMLVMRYRYKSNKWLKMRL